MPSFFRLRCWLLVAVFFVVLFVLGVLVRVSNSFAALMPYPGLCLFVRYSEPARFDICGAPKTVPPRSALQVQFDAGPGQFVQTWVSGQTSVCTSVDALIQLYYHDGHAWIYQSSYAGVNGTRSILPDSSPLDVGDIPSGTALPPGCCDAKRIELENECGPGNYDLDYATCAGQCKAPVCPDADSDGTPDVCDDCPDNPDVNNHQVNLYVSKTDAMCAGLKSGAYCGYMVFPCDGGEGSIHLAGVTWDQAQNCCGQTDAGTCSVDENCDPVHDRDRDDIPDDQDNDDDDDGIPDSEEGPDRDGDGVPDSEDNDDDGDDIPDDKDPDSNGDGIPDVDDPDGDGIPNDQDPDDDGDGTPDEEDEDTPDDGDDAPDISYPQKWQPDSDFFHVFETKLSDFFAKMQTTSLFSIPRQIFDEVPSGSGDHVFVFEGGETFGRYDLDLSFLSPGLAALRGILYIVFSIISLRIVFLKR